MRLGAYGEQGVTCTCGARGPWRCHGYGANGAGWEVEEPFRGFEGSGTCGRAIIQRRQEDPRHPALEGGPTLVSGGSHEGSLGRSCHTQPCSRRRPVASERARLLALSSWAVA